MTATPWYWSALACPDCARPFVESAPALRCACGFTQARAAPLDLRPHAPVPRVLTVPLGTSAPAALERCLVERPASIYSGPRATRDSAELFSAVLPQVRAGGTLLDLGCGPRDQAPPAMHLGLDYVGIDYSSPDADILADAHAIPFVDESFDFVLSYAVLEHLYNPFVALREVHRVLKPGGVYFGTVSQGEPYHESFFHHTAWGLLHGFAAAGLQPVRIWGSYDTLRGLARMGRYPRAGRTLIGLLDRFLEATPILSPRKHFKWPARDKAVDALHRAASICFVAERTAPGARGTLRPA